MTTEIHTVEELKEAMLMGIPVTVACRGFSALVSSAMDDYGANRDEAMIVIHRHPGYPSARKLCIPFSLVEEGKFILYTMDRDVFSKTVPYYGP